MRKETTQVGYGGKFLNDPHSGEIVLEIVLSLPFVAILMPAHYLYIVPNGIIAAKA